MKRPVLALAAVTLASLAVYSGFRMLASDETKIRWLLEDATESFNGTSVSGCVAGFHMDYKDKTDRLIDRGTLSQALLYMFMHKRDGKSDRFLYRVDLPAESLTILIEEDGEAVATFDLHLELQEQDDGERREAWRIGATAWLRETDGDWLIHRSSHRTISGRQPR
jgi:hypothetical protein